MPGGADLLLTLGDLNRDGLPDMVTVSPSQGTVGVWLNDRTTGFHGSDSHALAGQPIAATIGDFTGDGVADIAVATFSGGNVTTLVGAGDGSFKVRATAGSCTCFRTAAAASFNRSARFWPPSATTSSRRSSPPAISTATA